MRCHLPKIRVNRQTAIYDKKEYETTEQIVFFKKTFSLCVFTHKKIHVFLCFWLLAM